jgi:DNA-binding transcriptional LysR family regulator
MDFEIRLLRCALALAEHRNFARAAKAVYVSQPSLSRAIQELESQAGTRLFDRTNTGVDPTDAGMLFLEHAREVMSRAADLSREMNLLKGLEAGELRIGSGTYPSHMYVDRALARLIRKCPTVHIEVISENWSNLLPLLRKREVDLAIIGLRRFQEDADFHVIKLSAHHGYFAMRAGHPLVRKARRDVESALWNYPFVTTSRFPPELLKGLAEMLLGTPKASAQKSKTLVSITCESLPMMKTIAMNSDAVALLPWRMVAREVRSGKMTAVPAPAWLGSDFGIVHLAHRTLSPLAQTFVRLVQEADAELVDWEKKDRLKLESTTAS